LCRQARYRTRIATIKNDKAAAGIILFIIAALQMDIEPYTHPNKISVENILDYQKLPGRQRQAKISAWILSVF
jgi:hypothetical protein